MFKEYTLTHRLKEVNVTLSNIEKMVQDGTKMGQMSPMNLGLAQHR